MIDGIGTDAPVSTNERGGKQSASPYRMDLLPPNAALAVSRVLKQGAEKYNESDDDPNWHRIPVRDHLNHGLTHVYAHLAGDTQDEHLEHAATRFLMALELVLREGGDTDPAATPEALDAIAGDPAVMRGDSRRIGDLCPHIKFDWPRDRQWRVPDDYEPTGEYRLPEEEWFLNQDNEASFGSLEIVKAPILRKRGDA